MTPLNDKNVLDDKNLVPNFVFPFLFRIMHPTIGSWVHYPKGICARQLERTLLFLVPFFAMEQKIIPIFLSYVNDVSNTNTEVPLVNHVSYEFNDLMHISTYDRFWVGHFFSGADSNLLLDRHTEYFM